ncbi:MAG: hypothetical protein H6502_00700 [Candidatus Woesearchaeota archaeon]|nr:MAG: hypothetical protein H6502_00700 [Candidatus Woesearchaeota archaeon]
MASQKTFATLRKELLDTTKEEVVKATGPDSAIIACISFVDELESTIGKTYKKLLEWYDLFVPELELTMTEFIEAAGKQKPSALKKAKSMGGAFLASDETMIQANVKLLESMQANKEKNLAYLEQLTKKHLPNVHLLLGSVLTAKLVKHAGSLKKLASVPASTIQLYGAEKALFRHLKTRAKSPKHGVIITHPYVQESENKGKAARVLADKIAICARTDYFKGELIAKKILKELR